MNKRGLILSLIGIILVVNGILAYDAYSESDMPSKRPKVNIAYDGSEIPSAMGDHNWISRFGENSYIAGYLFDIGSNLKSVKAMPSSHLNVLFSSKPKNIKVLIWVDREKKPDVYQEVEGQKSYELVLPGEQGKYVFEIIGYWDDEHNTSNIVNISIE